MHICMCKIMDVMYSSYMTEASFLLPFAASARKSRLWMRYFSRWMTLNWNEPFFHNACLINTWIFFFAQSHQKTGTESKMEIFYPEQQLLCILPIDEDASKLLAKPQIIKLATTELTYDKLLAVYNSANPKKLTSIIAIKWMKWKCIFYSNARRFCHNSSQKRIMHSTPCAMLVWMVWCLIYGLTPCD